MRSLIHGSAALGITMNYCLSMVLFFAMVTAPLTVTAAGQQTVAIIGTGDMADSLGPKFAQLGYRVVYGSRTPDSDRARGLVTLTASGSTVYTQREAASQGDFVLTAVPWPPMEKVAQSLGDLSGKILIDISMPFSQAKDGYPQKLVATSSAEMIQGFNPGARVVKAWATVGSQVIDDTDAVNGPVSVPLASDDREAKETVARMVAAMGMDPVDFGPLRMAREIETLQMIYMIPLVQNRHDSWEFYFRRSNHWDCQGSEEWYEPVYDSDNLAEMPRTQEKTPPCPH